MKFLTEISEKTLGVENTEILGQKYELRKSARGIIIDNEGKMAVQHLTNYHYHKLPGGGIDPGETTVEALVREIREEVGFSIEKPTLLGIIIEYRGFENLLHISYGYMATAVEKISEPVLEPGEIAEGQVTKWVPPEEALELMKNDTPADTQGLFILEREKTFLEEHLRP